MSYLTHKGALYPVLSSQLLPNTQLRTSLRHFSRSSQYTQIISISSSKMKYIFCFVFLFTFALVLGCQDVQKKMIASSISPKQVIQNTARALESLKEVGSPTSETWKFVRERTEDPRVSEGCENDMNKIGNAKTGFLYDFQTTCYLIGNADLVLFMKANTETDVPGGKQCAKTPEFQAVYLPFANNANTYMILNPTAAPWFFTTFLSGCDIFVATNPGQPNRPIVIHSNLNEYKEHNLVNLQVKGIYADELLTDSRPGYQLIARVYHKPSPGEEMDVNNYLEKYKTKHQKIMLLSYPSAKPQIFLFFGHYDGHWTFFLKGEKDGTTSFFKVSARGEVLSAGGGKP